MKIAIIVHSHTGNTYSVAENLRKRLIQAGHSVNIEKVIAIKDDQTEVAKVQLQTNPDLSTYDGIIFGATVRGFSLSVVMTAYLSQVLSLKGKKIICYVTQFFPYAWMGGKRAIAQMSEICESKGAHISGMGIINWSHKQRKNRIDALTEDVNRIF